MNTTIKLYRLLVPVLILILLAALFRHRQLRIQRDKFQALAIDFQKVAKQWQGAAQQWQTTSEQWDKVSGRFEHEATNCQARLISVLK